MFSNQFLKLAYVRHIYSRLKEIKSALTSVFAYKTMKIDSTFQICKKLQGNLAKAAKCCTNITTETGEVMISVLTADESAGLKDMHQAIIKR